MTFAAVQPGAYHSCGLATSGVAYCWGNGTYGQRGDATKANSVAPGAVSPNLSLAAINVGAVHSCGLTATGLAYCWGLDYFAELGAGTPGQQQCGDAGVPCSTTPLAVAGGRSFASLSAGWDQTCAFEAGGAAYCWGDNTYGGLGDASLTSTRTPTAVTGGLTWRQWPRRRGVAYHFHRWALVLLHERPPRWPGLQRHLRRAASRQERRLELGTRDESGPRREHRGLRSGRVLSTKRGRRIRELVLLARAR